MATLLSEEQTAKLLQKLDVSWSLVGGSVLSRVYDFDDFKSALKFVNKVGTKAEKLKHHPDIELSWGKVVVNITTHSVGGLTKKDFELAESL